MREAWVTGEDALRERMTQPGQVDTADPEGALPPYLAAFLAHLRLLIGVPFEYLVPDPVLLPPESVRFFHLDRSWTDRLVDGVMAVGKIGTREQAHHQASAEAIASELDGLEREVRPAQRGLAPLPDGMTARAAAGGGAITGMLLRSAAVSGWPHMEVRAYAGDTQLVLDRLERLSPAVLLALFEGVPDRVELEEPHHGIQFGATTEGSDQLVVLPRDSTGELIQTSGILPFPVAMRDDEHRVIDLASLRASIYDEDLQRPGAIPAQTGSAAFAIELLQRPWRQIFADKATAGAPAVLRAEALPVARLSADLDADALAAQLRAPS